MPFISTVARVGEGDVDVSDSPDPMPQQQPLNPGARDSGSHE